MLISALHAVIVCVYIHTNTLKINVQFSQQLYEIRMIIIHLLQMRKLRPRKEKYFLGMSRIN